MALGVPVIICHLPQTLQDPQHLYIHAGPEPSTRNILLPHPAAFLGNLPFSQYPPQLSLCSHQHPSCWYICAMALL